jgi:crotonobetainyl-CoA:carnitine CoA-transferase CaiB-like acyl-CoA transferase
VFEAADQPFTVAIVSDRHFQLLATALEHPELIDAYPDNDTRMANRAKLTRVLSKIFAVEMAEHWVELLGEAGIPVGRVLSLSEAFDDPQSRHHGMLVEFEHPVAGLVQTTGSPIRINESQARADRIPPTLGQHTKELLIELGVDTDTASAMIADGRAVAS